MIWCLNSIQEMKLYLRTGFGESKVSYYGTIIQPFKVLLQLNVGEPAGWFLINLSYCSLLKIEWVWGEDQKWYHRGRLQASYHGVFRWWGFSYFGGENRNAVVRVTTTTPNKSVWLECRLNSIGRTSINGESIIVSYSMGMVIRESNHSLIWECSKNSSYQKILWTDSYREADLTPVYPGDGILEKSTSTYH